MCRSLDYFQTVLAFCKRPCYSNGLLSSEFCICSVTYLCCSFQSPSDFKLSSHVRPPGSDKPSSTKLCPLRLPNDPSYRVIALYPSNCLTPPPLTTVSGFTSRCRQTGLDSDVSSLMCVMMMTSVRTLWWVEGRAAA